MNSEFILHRAKFLQLVKQNVIVNSLKSFNDTLLFYYLAHLALRKNQGSLFEIGVGGSTHVLTELSEAYQRKFEVVDMNQERLEQYSNLDIFPQALIENHVVNSLDLNNSHIKNLCYCHLDGNKDYKIAVNDLKFCTENLTINGLICQDDYGNNKWPTVTDAVQHMIDSGQLVMLIVGDSSAWLTPPEYYDYWMQEFSTDQEFLTLADFVHMQSSITLSKYPNYLYMRADSSEPPPVKDNFILNFYDALLEAEHSNYLQMPYRNQSMPGIQFRQCKMYVIQADWHVLRGPDWPAEAPVTRQDIDNLPDWIKNELAQVHQIHDLYAAVQVLKDRCLRQSTPVARVETAILNFGESK